MTGMSQLRSALLLLLALTASAHGRGSPPPAMQMPRPPPPAATSDAEAPATPADTGTAAMPERAVRCGSPRRRLIALTFDDGPTPRFTPQLLDVLREHRVRATFFVLGRLVRRHPGLVRRMHREGHLVANHSFDHPRRATLAQWRAQLQRTEQLIRAADAPPAPFFRPPHGQISPGLLRLCHELGYTVVLYTVLSSDWARPGAAEIVRQAKHRLAPGGILALHDAGGDRRQTVEALPDIIRELRRRRYRLVTLDRLLGPDPRPVRCARPGRPRDKD